MTFMTKKNFLYKLIICICIFLALINIGTPKKVYASEEGSGVGGILIGPICSLLQGIGDGIMNIIQKSVMGTEATIAMDNSDESWWDKLGGFFIALIVIALVVVAACFAPGLLVAALKFVGGALIKAALTGVVVGAVVGYGALGNFMAAVSSVVADACGDTLVLPTYTISPEEIFTGKILLFDANIFNPKQLYVEYNTVDSEGNITSSQPTTVTAEQWKDMQSDSDKKAERYYYEKDGKQITTSVNNSSYELRNIIAKWYFIIRNIALLGSMIVLIYIGIRMMATSIAAEKAKYKQMLGDWIIAVCLIVLMHYIMIFAHSVVESITNILNNTLGNNITIGVVSGVEDKETLKGNIKKLETDEIQYLYEENGEEYIKWPTNLMGLYRIQAQEASDNMENVGYTLAFFALVIFTLVFTFTYLKRLLYLLFLTVIAPFVALTYPIDKIHDGKAQAFDMWLREYIFNLAIQPFHLILYTIFVTMAFELVSTNVIYALVTIGFMVPAEKFLRTMFGFNKASSPGLFAGAAGAAFTMSAISSLGRFAKGGHGGGNGRIESKGKENEDKNKLFIKPDSEHTQQRLYEGLVSGDSNSGEEPRTDSTNDSDNRSRELNTSQEQARLANEREYLEELQREARSENSNWSDEDFAAYQELQNQYNEDEASFMEQEQASDEDNIEEHVEAETQDIESNDIPETPNVKEKKRSKIGSTIAINTRLLGNELKSAAKQGIKEIPGDAIKFGAGAASALALGGIGLAAGIASGDPSTALKNTTAAAGIGAALSTGTINRVEADVKRNYQSIEAKREQVEKEYYGDRYNEVMREKAKETFMKDKAMRRRLQNELNIDKGDKEKIKQAMDAMYEYKQYGIQDDSLIIKGMKVNKNNSDKWADKESIASVKLAENSKSNKELEENLKRFGSVKGITQKQVENMRTRVRELNNL